METCEVHEMGEWYALFRGSPPWVIEDEPLEPIGRERVCGICGKLDTEINEEE